MHTDKLNEIYQEMLEAKRTIDLVDLDLAGYNDMEIFTTIREALNKLAKRKNLPEVDWESLKDILYTLRFKAPRGSVK